MATQNTHETPTYRVTIDTDACEGIFACLVRDPRFVEADDGLATIDPDADPVGNGDDGRIREEDGRIVAEFADDRIDEARTAAAACPPNAITVEECAPRATNEDGRATPVTERAEEG